MKAARGIEFVFPPNCSPKDMATRRLRRTPSSFQEFTEEFLLEWSRENDIQVRRARSNRAKVCCFSVFIVSIYVYPDFWSAAFRHCPIICTNASCAVVSCGLCPMIGSPWVLLTPAARQSPLRLMIILILLSDHTDFFLSAMILAVCSFLLHD